MNIPIAFCGLECESCPALIAKQTNDDKLRQKTAQKWSSLEFLINPEDINCDGCHSEGILLKDCNICSVRLCGLAKEIKSCAECPDYQCDKLIKLWKTLHAPEAKVRLDQLKKKC